MGQLSTVAINPTGIVSAVYTNGRSTQLGQLAMANFPNPQGLKSLGDTNWSETFTSGTVVSGVAGSAGFGSIQSGALESSNVDLTTQLVDMIGITSETAVLDAGTGIGGTARFVADRCHCRVTAVDLTEEYCETAGWLNRLVGLDDRIAVRQADVTDLPFAAATFDVVFSQHVQMNVADKGRLYSEAHRVLVQGGRLAMWDITSAGRGELGYPLPWPTNPDSATLRRPPSCVLPSSPAGSRSRHGMISPTRRPRRWRWCCHCLPIRSGCTPSSPALRRRPRTCAPHSQTDGCELSNASLKRADQVGEYLCDVGTGAGDGA